MPAAEVSSNEKPNIVIIYADDMGYGDCTANNLESKIPTPNIDHLAAEGMRFTDAHSPATVCTPSRYGLLTGINPAREGIVNPLLKFGTPHSPSWYSMYSSPFAHRRKGIYRLPCL